MTRLAIPSENIRAAILKSLPPDIGLWPSTPLEKLPLLLHTDAESISLMKSHVAYTGKYDVDSAQTPDVTKITIHVDAASNQALTGSNRIFYARIDGNKLRLKLPALVVGTSGVTSIVELEYVKAE